MKIIGFGDTGIIKDTIRKFGFNPSRIRKVVVGQGILELYFHNGDPMIKIDSPTTLTKQRK